MRVSLFPFFAMCMLAMSGAHFSSHAAAPSVVATASPSSGAAPLSVLFDGSGSAANGAVTYQWEFGDGGSSTSSQVAHVFTVAGTYTTTLVVADAAGNMSNPAQITITVTGTGAGVVTPNMNFRIAPVTATFKINRKAPNSDSLTLRGTFNTVDLPPSLLNLAASVSINGAFSINGIIDGNNGFQNPANNTTPSYFVFVDVRYQQIYITINKANLGKALGLTGAVDATVTKPVPVNISFTIGSQSYDFTQTFSYTGVQGVSAVGKFDLSKHLGDIGEGFFVVSSANAIEVPDTHSHFFQFNGYLARSSSALINIPPAGTPPPPTASWTFTLNLADKIVVPIDRFQVKGNLISYVQPDRALGGIHSVLIDTLKRTFVVSTWDIKSNPNYGGSGLPVRGENFVSYVFTLRIDLDQFDTPGTITTLSGVTATRLARKTTDDAFWQTGRSLPPKN